MRAAALALAVALATPHATFAAGGDLVLKRVMLSSAGVGYFEYEAAVDGAASLGLDVKLDQVDDVLKSLAVFDDAGGVGAIELPGRDDTHAAFGDVPFGPDALRSPVEFLNSLQGVELQVQGPRPMAGRLLRAEVVREPAEPPGSPPATRTRVSLLTPDGLRQFVLEDSDSIQVADEALRGRIERALAASRRQSAGDSRHITLRASGDGSRTVRAGFVAAAPLWKASYRVLLPPADAGAGAHARLQGWATLENATGADWSDVSLSVQYGNPVTFRQALYRSYFVTRPEAPVEVLGRLLPDVDTRARLAGAAAPAVPPPPPAAGLPPDGSFRAKDRRAAAAPAPVPAPSMDLALPAEPVAVQEGVEETVFAVPFPVSLQAGHTASVPLLDASVPAQRISLATEGEAHPLAAIRVENSTGASLPAGVLTLYDPASTAPYAGDARLGGLPAGETRLLSYAQDLRTTVEWRSEDVARVVSMAASGGVLTVDARRRRIVHATLTAPAHEPRRVLLEVAKPDGGEVAPGFAVPSEQTATAWRFAADLQPGAVQEVVAAVDTRERQTFALLDDDDAVTTVLNLQGVSPGARAALRHIADLRQAEADRASERDALNGQRDAVTTDEERLRANLGAVGPGDAVRTRLLRQLDADETRLATLSTALDKAEAAVADAHNALTNAVAALRL